MAYHKQGNRDQRKIINHKYCSEDAFSEGPYNATEMPKYQIFKVQ